MEVFPKRKELASLKQLFVLHGKISIFLHAPPLNAGTYKVGHGVNITSLVFGLICFYMLHRRDRDCAKIKFPYLFVIQSEAKNLVVIKWVLPRFFLPTVV